MACPLAAGQPALLLVRQKLPVLAPPGPYDLQLEGQDAAGLHFLCIKLHFTMVTAVAAAGQGAAAAAAAAAGAAVAAPPGGLRAQGGAGTDTPAAAAGQPAATGGWRAPA
jgi:hypothetical protein